MSNPNIDVLIGGPKNKHSYTYKEVILKENFPLSQQMVEKNRKYVIKWNFDLNGETVTVPENCILEFDGGTLHNGTIIGQDTFVNDIGGLGLEKLFAEDIVREGTWRTNGGGSFEQVQSDWNQADDTKEDFIKNKPKLSDVATSGSYNDLKNKPNIPEGVTVDTALSKTSINPVQNKVIAEALEKAGNIDKPYDPTTHSGLGRKTLELKEGGSNVLTQEDFDQENTIYIVQYDFGLDGQEIQIPTNCIIKFDGGSVDNGMLVGSHTKLSGDYRSSVSSLFGLFYNEIDEPLTWDKNEISNICFYPQYGNLAKNIYRKTGEIAPNPFISVQSIGISDDNIFVFSNNVTFSLCAIYDRNFLQVGLVKLAGEGNSHWGDVALKDGYFYFGPGNEKPGKLTKVSVAEIISKMTSVDDIVAGTPYKEIITSDIEVGNEAIYLIDYDDTTKTFCADIHDHLTILDSNFNVVKRVEESYMDQVAEIMYRERVDPSNYTFIRQGLAYKNGVVYISCTNGQRSFDGQGILIAYDMATESVSYVKHIITEFNGFEFEGLFKDHKTGLVYSLGQFNDGVTEINNVVVGCITLCQEDELILDRVGLRNASTSMPVSGRTGNMRRVIYVDNTYTKLSNGTNEYPYKSIGEAFVLTSGAISSIEIVLVNTEKPYFHYRLQNYFNFLYIRSSSGTVELNATIVNRHSMIELENLYINPNDETNHGYNDAIRLYQSSFIMQNCSIGLDVVDTAITAEYSEVNIEMCSFEGDTEQHASINSNTLTKKCVSAYRSNTYFGSCTFKNIVVMFYSNGSFNSKTYVHVNNTLTDSELVWTNGRRDYDSVVIPQISERTEFDKVLSAMIYGAARCATVILQGVITLDNGAILTAGKYIIDGGKLLSYSGAGIYNNSGLCGPSNAKSATPVYGQMYFDTTNDLLWSYSGSAWKEFMPINNIDILQNVDLDDVVSVTKTYVVNGEDISTITHAPSEIIYSYKLVVEANGGNYLQTIKTRSNDIYTRASFNGLWTAWKKITAVEVE